MHADVDTRESRVDSFRLPVVLTAGALAVSLVLLAASGVMLVFSYRPGANGLWERDLHRFAAVAAQWLALLLAVLLIARWFVHRHTEPGLRGSAVIGGLALVLVFFGGLTGYLLPWEQLALRPVAPPTDFRGIYDAAFDPSVRFVLMGGVEVGQPTYRLWTVVHTVVVPVVLLALAAWAIAKRVRQSAP